MRGALCEFGGVVAGWIDCLFASRPSSNPPLAPPREDGTGSLEQSRRKVRPNADIWRYTALYNPNCRRYMLLTGDSATYSFRERRLVQSVSLTHR